MSFSASARTFFYRNRTHSAIPPMRHNYVNREFGTYTSYLLSSFLKNHSVRNALLSQLKSFGSPRTVLQTDITFRWLVSEMAKLRSFLKNHSFLIIRTCTQQCECVVAHRVRRGHQIFNLYNRLWDEVALRELGRRLRQQLMRRGKEMFLSAVGVSAFNWEKDKIPDEEMLRHTAELEEMRYLYDARKTCPNCHLRRSKDKKHPDEVCCKCPSSSSPPVSKMKGPSDWKPFMEGEDVLIWRKQQDSSRGLYAYKVYGKYNDVSAEVFLQAQIDIEYRKEWDNTAVTLKIIDSDPASNSDVIYWEMEWPKLFSNRDYIFNRRYMICQEKNVIVIVNKCIEHPCCPVKKGNYRVKEYWSYMVIKPLTHFREPGIEFVLTYFDNPGVSIPSTLSTWVVMTGLPDFLSRLRKAAKELGARHPKTEPLVPVETSYFQDPEENANRKHFFQKLNAARLFL